MLRTQAGGRGLAFLGRLQESLDGYRQGYGDVVNEAGCQQQALFFERGDGAGLDLDRGHPRLAQEGYRHGTRAAIRQPHPCAEFLLDQRGESLARGGVRGLGPEVDAGRPCFDALAAVRVQGQARDRPGCVRLLRALPWGRVLVAGSEDPWTGSPPEELRREVLGQGERDVGFG